MKFESRQTLLPLVTAIVFFLVATPVAAGDEPPLASAYEVEAASSALEAWTAAYSAGDYHEQWLLTDKRITRWFDRRSFRKMMTEAQQRNGLLKTYSITGAAPARASDLPCTEMGHCYRTGIQYAIFVIESTYEKAEPSQPEFAVMAKAEGKWVFGGGSFLNRPLGETAVIMTEQDERRYEPRYPVR